MGLRVFRDLVEHIVHLLRQVFQIAQTVVQLVKMTRCFPLLFFLRQGVIRPAFLVIRLEIDPFLAEAFFAQTAAFR